MYNTNQGETNGVEKEEYQTNLVQNDYDKQKNNIKTSKIIEIKFNTQSDLGEYAKNSKIVGMIFQNNKWIWNDSDKYKNKAEYYQMDVEEYETDQNQANRPMVTTKVEIQQNI